MKTQLELEFLVSLQRSRASTSCFTLVKLMIFVGVVGLLTAVALPRYLQAWTRSPRLRRANPVQARASEGITIIGVKG